MKYILCIGSNTDPQQNMTLAVNELTRHFPGIHFSSEQISEPMGTQRPDCFLNRAACFESDMEYEEVRAITKEIERKAGRTPDEKYKEIIRLDVDILQAGTQRFKEHDWQQLYVQRLLRQLELRFVGIIPARYASTRFPAKPLALLGGKPVIQRVYEQVSSVLDDAYVATDDERIFNAVQAFGGKVVMTSTHHKSGTDRCWEAYQKIGGAFDVIINIQGDEPFIQPSQIEALKACFLDDHTHIATLAMPLSPNSGLSTIDNPNVVKMVVNKNMNALYFSRSIIPYQRNVEKADWLSHHIYYRHIGLYAYRAEVLQQITALAQSSLELAESLEQLRWLENGYTIKVGVTNIETIGIDTPADLERAEAFLQQQKS
ncbi:MAG: 3-deoxy-manno-octulosonate cytidylyltransferase [Bacteroidaceae bacterium]|nr:3-deoxy-manno-octulosonate cytidylyltransferase [Bacteroidaceae bacterium]